MYLHLYVVVIGVRVHLGMYFIKKYSLGRNDHYLRILTGHHDPVKVVPDFYDKMTAKDEFTIS